METESLRLIRNRRAELQERLDDLRAQIGPVEFELKQAEAAIILMTGVKPVGAEASRGSVAHYLRKKNPEIAQLTIKELVLKALSEHLPNGGTSQQLLQVFTREWGRMITRTSLSPQLTRLKDAGKIVLDGKVWHEAERYHHDVDLDFDAFRELEAEALNENGAAGAAPDAGGGPTPLDDDLPSEAQSLLD